VHRQRPTAPPRNCFRRPRLAFADHRWIHVWRSATAPRALWMNEPSQTLGALDPVTGRAARHIASSAKLADVKFTGGPHVGPVR